MVTFDGRAPGTPADDWSADARLARPRPDRAAGRRAVWSSSLRTRTTRRWAPVACIAELAAAGRPPEIVVVTDGSASHPGSATLAPSRLAELRADEVRRAVALLSPDSPVTLLGHPDGGVLEDRDSIARELAEISSGRLRP